MDVKEVLNCIHSGLKKVLKGLKVHLLKPADTLYLSL